MAERHQLNNLKNIRDPYRCLALAVLASAYKENSPASKSWLQSDDRYLKFWCEAGQVSVDKLHRRMMEGRDG